MLTYLPAPGGAVKHRRLAFLARSLNCVQGPTSTPCGVCNSCVSLAPGGPGNLDVVELDAASHNGVDDMRDLRDRATYAPAESRYRIFIIDEAHMITTQGFNALLKIVEEPPEHLIFIFATTEPEKVIGTIRSRTHNYPFRLLAPPDMRMLLERTCQAESVQVEDSVYPLIIRAGGGSPRDSLSVLDQLLAGTGPEGLTYDLASRLLGITSSTLIDAAVDALATSDSAGMFLAVDHAIAAGLEPRRFTADLLDHFRDLMVLQAVPDAVDNGLVDAPQDRIETLQRQAASFQPAALAAIASTINSNVDEMRNATAPRLLLEILAAKLILSASGEGAVQAAPCCFCCGTSGQRRLRPHLHPRPRQVVGSTSGNPSVLRGKQPRLQRRHLLLQNLNPKWHKSRPQNPNLFQRPNPWWSNSRSRNQNQHQNPNPNPRSLPRLLPSRSVRSGQPCARRLGARIRLPRLCSPKPGCWACATARWLSGTTLAPWPLD